MLGATACSRAAARPVTLVACAARRAKPSPSFPAAAPHGPPGAALPRTRAAGTSRARRAPRRKHGHGPAPRPPRAAPRPALTQHHGRPRGTAARHAPTAGAEQQQQDAEDGAPSRAREEPSAGRRHHRPQHITTRPPPLPSRRSAGAAAGVRPRRPARPEKGSPRPGRSRPRPAGVTSRAQSRSGIVKPRCRSSGSAGSEVRLRGGPSVPGREMREALRGGGFDSRRCVRTCAVVVGPGGEVGGVSCQTCA